MKAKNKRKSVPYWKVAERLSQFETAVKFAQKDIMALEVEISNLKKDIADLEIAVGKRQLITILSKD